MLPKQLGQQFSVSGGNGVTQENKVKSPSGNLATASGLEHLASRFQ
jgi:hypothetical protein